LLLILCETLTEGEAREQSNSTMPYNLLIYGIETNHEFTG